MDIKDIRFYMECYEARSINKAAKSLFITPQGLGKALDRIETELQVKLFNRKSLKIADLKDEQLISLNEKYQAYDNLINSCEREGFFPHIRIKTMEAAMIYEFVREGIGIGIDVDIHNREGLFENVALIPIKDAIPWSVYLVYKSEKRKDECLLKLERSLSNPLLQKRKL